MKAKVICFDENYLSSAEGIASCGERQDLALAIPRIREERRQWQIKLKY